MATTPIIKTVPAAMKRAILKVMLVIVIKGIELHRTSVQGALEADVNDMDKPSLSNEIHETHVHKKTMKTWSW